MGLIPHRRCAARFYAEMAIPPSSTRLLIHLALEQIRPPAHHPVDEEQPVQVIHFVLYRPGLKALHLEFERRAATSLYRGNQGPGLINQPDRSPCSRPSDSMPMRTMVRLSSPPAANA